jgi:hypothetical protein
VILRAAAGLAAAAGVGLAGQEAQGLLPDLHPRPPGRLIVGGTHPPFRLGFASAVGNIGAGPLRLDAARRSRSHSEMQAAQLVRTANGGDLRYPSVGVVRYSGGRGHGHWHLVGFQRYELRSADGAVVISAHKQGFCLGDRYRVRPSARFPGQPPKPPFRGNCGKDKPALLRLTQGISVGYGDNYGPFAGGQSFNLTGLPEGEYLLIARVNPDRSLRERDYGNNASAVRLQLLWPRGESRPAKVKMVAVCLAAERC